MAKRVPPPSAKRPRGTASEQMARNAIAHAEPAHLALGQWSLKTIVRHSLKVCLGFPGPVKQGAGGFCPTGDRLENAFGRS